ncbi:MAG: outer membrane protein assembly factor BamB family protein, partial [Planctomycetota bacterium]
ISRETDWTDHGRAADLWRLDVGLGHSSFAAVDGRLYTLGYDEARRLDTIYCLDAETGEPIWTHEYPCDIWNQGHTGGTLTTPAVDGDAVYTSNREGRLFCLDAMTGAVRWSRHLGEEFEVAPHIYGFAASPLVLPDMVVMNVDRTIAFDKVTGRELWMTESLYGRAFSTPVDFELDGARRLAVFNGVGLVVLDRDSGRELARHPWSRNSETNPATPIVLDDRIFISAGYNDGCTLLRLDEAGLTPIWKSRVMRNKVGTSILIDGHVYGFDESMFKCIDLEGNERWRVRGMGMGSLTAAGDRLIIVTSRGELVVAEASPEAFRELSRTKVLDGGTCWATPVLHDGRIYCRNSEGEVVCRDHRPHAPAVAAGETGDGAGTGAGGGAGAVTAAPAGPDPGALRSRHRAAVGGADALSAGTFVALSGTFDRRAEGAVATPMRLWWRAPDQWMIEYEDLLGRRVYGRDARGAWALPAPDLAEVLEGDELLWLSETAGIVRWFEHRAAAPAGETLTGTREFDGRDCYVVSTTLPDGSSREHFYEIATGRRAGQDGETTPTVVYGDYRPFGPITIPTRITVYEAETGIMQVIAIEDARVGDEQEAGFSVPDAVRGMPRTPVEIAAADAAARRRWGTLLGRYARDPDAPDAAFEVLVRSGRLAVRTPRRSLYVLREPDEAGRWVFASVPRVAVSFRLDDAGRPLAMLLHQEGAEDMVLTRLPAVESREPGGAGGPGS